MADKPYPLTCCPTRTVLTSHCIPDLRPPLLTNHAYPPASLARLPAKPHPESNTTPNSDPLQFRLPFTNPPQGLCDDPTLRQTAPTRRTTPRLGLALSHRHDKPRRLTTDEPALIQPDPHLASPTRLTTADPVAPVRQTSPRPVLTDPWSDVPTQNPTTQNDFPSPHSPCPFDFPSPVGSVAAQSVSLRLPSVRSVPRLSPPTTLITYRPPASDYPSTTSPRQHAPARSTSLFEPSLIDPSRRTKPVPQPTFHVAPTPILSLRN